MDIDGERTTRLQGIKKRWIYNYIMMLVVVLLLVEVGFIFFIKSYFYGNVSESLTVEIENTVNVYQKFLISKTNATLDEIIKKVTSDEPESKKENFEFQIVDPKGNIKLSSTGFLIEDKLDTYDYKGALDGNKTVWKGKADTEESVMSVSAPIRNKKGNIIGVIRYVTSLSTVNKSVAKVMIISIGFFIFIVILIFITGLLFSKTIIDPIKNINRVAKKLAEGKFLERVESDYDDEIGELAQTLNIMADQIVHSTNMKNEFISSVSHELRTPLTSIKGWSETIIEGNFEDKEEARLGLNIISKETTRLSDMVEELLDFSKIEGGKIVLYLEELDTKKEIKEIVSTTEARARKDGVEIIYYELERELPDLIGDQNRLKQVFINIIDNAIKFTPSGKKVYISIKKEEEFIAISIRDEGIGISESDLSQITEKFFKGTSKKSGSGIGLAVTKEIIGLHKGELEIKSKLEEGTTVTVRIPFVK